MYIISACLLGENVRYDGGNSETSWIGTFAQSHRIYSCCPERLGGLPCPRPPAERLGTKVVNNQGQDVTQAFCCGAEKAWEEANQLAKKWGEPIEGAILKSNSPSCGKGTIYDGTFQKVLMKGNGVFAQLLIDRGIRVITEKEKTDDSL